MTSYNMSNITSFMDEIVNVTTRRPRGGPPPVGYYGDTRIILWKVIPPILITFGTIGNILTTVVLLRQIKRLSSTAIFLLALALSDTMILWLGPLRNWIKHMWNVDVRYLSDSGCKAQLYLTYVSVHMSSWFLVAVTMERVLSVVRPHKVKLMCTSRNAVVVVVVMVIVILCVDIPIPIIVGLHGSTTRVKCTPTTEAYVKFRDNVYEWIDFCMSFALPFMFLLLGNILIILKLVKSNRNKQKMNVSRGERSGRSTKSISFLLISLCIVFILTMSPVTIFHVYTKYYFQKIKDMTDRYEQYYAYQRALFEHTVVNLVGYINASTNFLLYVFSGSKFRNELKALFTCKRSPSRGVFGSQKRESNDTKSSSLQYTNTSASQPKMSLTSTILSIPTEYNQETCFDNYVDVTDENLINLDEKIDEYIGRNSLNGREVNTMISMTGSVENFEQNGPSLTRSYSKINGYINEGHNKDTISNHDTTEKDETNDNNNVSFDNFTKPDETTNIEFLSNNKYTLTEATKNIGDDTKCDSTKLDNTQNIYSASNEFKETDHQQNIDLASNNSTKIDDTKTIVKALNESAKIHDTQNLNMVSNESTKTEDIQNINLISIQSTKQKNTKENDVVLNQPTQPDDIENQEGVLNETTETNATQNKEITLNESTTDDTQNTSMISNASTKTNDTQNTDPILSGSTNINDTDNQEMEQTNLQK